MWGKDWVSGGRGKFSQNVMYEERVNIIKNCWQFCLFTYLNFLEQCLVGEIYSICIPKTIDTQSMLNRLTINAE